MPRRRRPESEPRHMEPIAVKAKKLAEMLDCSVRKIRQMTPDLPHYRHGGVVLFPVEEVRRVLTERARELNRR